MFNFLIKKSNCHIESLFCFFVFRDSVLSLFIYIYSLNVGIYCTTGLGDVNSALNEPKQLPSIMNLLSKQTHEAVSTCIRVAYVIGRSLD